MHMTVNCIVILPERVRLIVVLVSLWYTGLFIAATVDMADAALNDIHA